MDFMTLTSNSHVSKPVHQRPQKDSLPAKGRPDKLDNGPPGTGAPPPDKKAVRPQKEVNANEQKPQAKILDLLEEILPVDLATLLPQKGRPELSDHSDTATLGFAMGDLKANADSLSVVDLLGALGVKLPQDIDVHDTGLIKKAVAEQIVEYGIPPNVRGLLASLLQSEDANSLSSAVTFDTDAVTSAVRAAPLTLRMSTTPDDILVQGDRLIGPPIKPTLKPAADPLTDPLIGPPIAPSVDQADDILVKGDRLIGPPIAPSADLADDILVQGDRLIGPPIAPSVDLADDILVQGDRLIGPPIKPTLKPDADPLTDPLNGSSRLRGLKAVVNTDSADRVEVKARVSHERNLGTLSLGTHGVDRARDIRHLDKRVVDALKLSHVDTDPNAARKVDIEQLANSMNRGFALMKAPLTHKMVTAAQDRINLTPDVSKDLHASINVNGKIVDFSIDGTALKPRDADVAPKPELTLSAKVQGSDTDMEVKPFDDSIINEDTSLEDSLFDEDAMKSNNVSATKSSKSVAPTSSKVEIAMERVSDVHNKIIEHVQEVAAKHGHGRTTIRLNPDDLGSITVSVRAFGGNIDTKITASNEHVRHALHVQRGDLVLGIESRGLQMNSFTVGQEAGGEAQAQNESNAQNQQGETMRKEFERANNLAAAHTPAPTQATSPSHNVSRSDEAVDYLA